MKNLVISIIEFAIVGGIIYGFGKLMVLVGLIENGAPYWVCFIGAIGLFVLLGFISGNRPTKKASLFPSDKEFSKMTYDLLKKNFSVIPNRYRSSYNEKIIFLYNQKGALSFKETYEAIYKQIGENPDNDVILYAILGYFAVYVLRDDDATKLCCNNCLDLLGVRSLNDNSKCCDEYFKWMVADSYVREKLFDASGNRIK